MIDMRFPMKVTVPSGLAATLICVSAVSWAQTNDDAFYRWGLETYRQFRAADDPSGAMLPLPSKVGSGPGVSLVFSSAGVEMADVTQERVVEDEAYGLLYPDGPRGSFAMGGVIVLPGSIKVQLGGRFMSEHRGATRGEWLDRSAYWMNDRLEIRAGMVRTFWGDGYEGSLLLGRTAPPFETIRVRTIRPARIPGLGSAGRFHASAFLGYLDDGERVVPNPLLHGARLEWEPTNWSRFSLTRTILFGGAGRTNKLKLRDLWNILLARNENRKDMRDYRDSDQLASFGLELRLPSPLTVRDRTPIDGGRVFYEYAGEDGFHGIVPRAPAHHFGVSLTSHGWVGLAEISDTMTRANPWYAHWTYGVKAYFYRGYPIGHPMGTLAWSRHVRLWTPVSGGARAQFWYRQRHHEATVAGGMGGERSLGVALRRDIDALRILELELEGYRATDGTGLRSPVRWRGSVAIRVGASSTSMSAP